MTTSYSIGKTENTVNGSRFVSADELPNSGRLLRPHAGNLRQYFDVGGDYADGVEFSTWDQWFLTILFGELDRVWPALRDQLRAKRRGAGFDRDDAEAKLSHLWRGAG